MTPLKTLAFISLFGAGARLCTAQDQPPESRSPRAVQDSLVIDGYTIKSFAQPLAYRTMNSTRMALTFFRDATRHEIRMPMADYKAVCQDSLNKNLLQRTIRHIENRMQQPANAGLKYKATSGMIQILSIANDQIAAGSAAGLYTAADVPKLYTAFQTAPHSKDDFYDAITGLENGNIALTGSLPPLNNLVQTDKALFSTTRSVNVEAGRVPPKAVASPKP